MVSILRHLWTKKLAALAVCHSEAGFCVTTRIFYTLKMRVSSYDPIWTSACAFSHVPVLDSRVALTSQDQRPMLWTVL